MMPVAYSYARFSDSRQEEGDSIRRQADLAERWAERHGYRIDTTLVYRDKGKSAFKDKPRAALTRFLSDVRSGTIPAGSTMLIENIDRLSRSAPWDFIGLLHELVKAGIRIVQVDTGEVLDQKTDMFGLMRVLLSQSRGHDESKKKSDRGSENWDQWRKTGQSKGGKIRPGPVPFWIGRDKGGSYTLNDKEPTIRQICQWAADGWGSQRITRQLRRDGTKVIDKKGSDGFPSQPYLVAVLKNPALYGRCEELDRDDYFPAVITREQFFTLQAVKQSRTRKGVRVRERVHLLTGLIENYVTGSSYVTRKWEGTNRYVYYPYDMRSTNETDGTSFPVEPLETAVMDCVRELDPAQLASDDDKPDTMTALVGEADNLKTRIAELEQEMEDGESAAGVRVVRKLEKRLAEVNSMIAEERVRLSTPVVESLSAVQRMVNVKGLDLTDDETRLKVRTGLGKVIDKVRVSFSSSGVWRLAYAVVQLRESNHFREIVALYHRPLAGVVPEYFYAEGDQRFSKDDVTPAEPETAFAYLQEIIDRVDAERNAEKRERRKEYYKTYNRLISKKE